MQIKSIYRGARISAFKCREVTREIQGLPVAAALELLAFTPRKAAGLIAKTLKSAVANAENNNQLRAEKLVVQEATVGEGPTFKRFQPKARGSAGPIRKRTSHIRIIVTDEIKIVSTRKPKKSASRHKSQKSKTKSAPAKAETPVVSEPAKVETPVVSESAQNAPSETQASTPKE